MFPKASSSKWQLKPTANQLLHGNGQKACFAGLMKALLRGRAGLGVGRLLWGAAWWQQSQGCCSRTQADIWAVLTAWIREISIWGPFTAESSLVINSKSPFGAVRLCCVNTWEWRFFKGLLLYPEEQSFECYNSMQNQSLLLKFNSSYLKWWK